MIIKIASIFISVIVLGMPAAAAYFMIKTGMGAPFVKFMASPGYLIWSALFVFQIFFLRPPKPYVLFSAAALAPAICLSLIHI